MAKKTTKRKSRAKKSVGGPFLVSAVLCEKIITEKNNVATLIRIVDKFTLGPIGNIPQAFMEQAAFRVFAFISFKSGDAKGKKNLRIKMRLATGETSTETSVPLVFKGGSQGPSAHVEMGVPAKEGLHWIEVYLDTKLVTKMPLKVVISKS